MTDVTQILNAIEQGDPSASEQLLPLVYDELRKLAATKMARENPSQTLQATALVHEAYLRLVDGEKSQHWDNRGHFFAAAAEAMRRILVERARHKGQLKYGGGHNRADMPDLNVLADEKGRDEILAIDSALDALGQEDSRLAELVKLRYFAGLTLPEAAVALGVSTRTTDRLWAYAKSWLLRELAR